MTLRPEPWSWRWRTLSSGGANELAQVIAERIAGQTQRPDALELGTIQGALGLKLDRFAVPIPKGEYLIADWTAKLNLPAFSLVGSGEYPVKNDGSPEPVTEWTAQTRWDWHPRAIDKVKIEIKPDLKPGDRVLVAWVNDGTDPVIVSKVVSS